MTDTICPVCDYDCKDGVPHPECSPKRFANIKTNEQFVRYPIDPSAVSFGRRLAHLIYWR